MSSWELANTVLTTLVAQGVQDVVLSPGSRNASLAMALHQLYQRGDIRLHIRVDERSAGFTALGIAKASGNVAAVVTTSGTAVGNLTPAVMEANASQHGLILITADRPSYLVGTGANQTTNQLGQFGAATREVIRLNDSGNEAYWRSATLRAWAIASGIRTCFPGPVQFNLEFDTPFMPTNLVGVIPEKIEISAPVSAAAVHLNSARTVILAGDGSLDCGWQARLTAEKYNLPLFAEPSSNARQGSNAISTYRLLLSNPQFTKQIERVIVFGHPTLSRSVSSLLGRDNVEIVIVSDKASWFDQTGRASLITNQISLETAKKDWILAWQQADNELRTKITQLLNGELNGLNIAESVVKAGGQIFFGSSSPIRDADLAAISPIEAAYANRGLSGIDGAIATASGIAIKSNKPTTLLVGDLTFLHDLGSLAISNQERDFKLRIVVANDDGGAIFSILEQGALPYRDSFEKVFATPTGADILALARACQTKVTEISSLEQLRKTLGKPIEGIEVLVAKIDRAQRRQLHETLITLGKQLKFNNYQQ